MTISGVPNRATIWRNLYCRKWNGLRVNNAHDARQVPDSIVTVEIVTPERVILGKQMLTYGTATTNSSSGPRAGNNAFLHGAG